MKNSLAFIKLKALFWPENGESEPLKARKPSHGSQNLYEKNLDFDGHFFFGPILKASTGLLIPKLKPKYFKTTLKFVKILHKNTTTTKVMSIYISIYIPKD